VFVAGATVIGVASALLLRSGPLHIDPANPSGPTAAACGELARHLPATVTGQTRRPVDPVSATTAAWGADPVVLRCGVGTPAALLPTSELTTVDGIDWLPEHINHGYRYTTVGRVAGVEVTVPDTYQPEVNALVDLSASILADDPAVPTPT
jgi:hypothetical protein